MIDLNTLQQQMMQPETGLDRAMADPIFQIGLAMMSSPNIGQALQQGLKTSQALKISKLDNQLRLAELQARMMPETAKPTALMRHMEIASDPNNPLAQMMQKYLFKPTGTSVRVSMPGPQVPRMQQVNPNFVQWIDPKDPTKGYLEESAETGLRVSQIPGAQKPTEQERLAATRAESASKLNAAMKKYEDAGMNDAALIASGVADTSGPITGYAARKAANVIDESAGEYRVPANRYVTQVVRTDTGAAMPKEEQIRYTNDLTVVGGETVGQIRRKQALRDQVDAELARRGSATIDQSSLDDIMSKTPPAAAFEPDAVPTPAPQVNQPPASLPNSTGDAWLDSALGIK